MKKRTNISRKSTKKTVAAVRRMRKGCPLVEGTETAQRNHIPEAAIREQNLIFLTQQAQELQLGYEK